MKCYNCGAELSEHGFCTNCRADVRLYKKIIFASNYFYNQGLERAKVRDLQGATESLRQSLRFNKKNIRARNLLGLIYFEEGEIVSALSEWVISTNIRPKKNLATEYIDTIHSNSAKLEVMNQSIRKYNLALQYCQNDSVDLAIVQLKNVIKTNPNLLRAHQLLALCYIKIGKAEMARRCLTKALEIDNGNTTVLRYMQEVNNVLNAGQDKKNKENFEPPKVLLDGNDIVIQPPEMKDRKGSATILNILVGMAIGFAIAFFLVLPAEIQKVESKSAEEIKSIGTQLDAKNLSINELESTVSDLNTKVSSLTQTLDNYAGTEGTILAMESLLKASAIYLETPENVAEVADYITAVDPAQWTNDTSENYKALYYALKAAIGPSVCDLYYTEANTAFKAKQYEDAIAYLESAVFFDAEDVDALYLLAQSYEKAEKTDQAKDAYRKVSESFPDSWQAGRAASALKKLEAE